MPRTGSPSAARSASVAVLTAALASPLLAVPAQASAARPQDSYIVTFAHSTGSGHVAAASADARRHGASIRFTYSRAVKGFAGTLSPEALAALRSDPRVDTIERDRRVRPADTTPAPAT